MTPMNIEHKIIGDDEIIPRTATYRTAFFNDMTELLITLALIAVTFIIAFARRYGSRGEGFIPIFVFAFAGTVGFASLTAFVIFFRGKKFTFQTSKDRFMVFRGKGIADVFYYSEITAVDSAERKFFGIRRGFTVTVNSSIKTKSYRVICPSHVTFENFVFTEIKKNIKIWEKDSGNNKEITDINNA